MERITPVNPQAVQGRAKELLDAVKAKLGLVPNMTRSMAVSPPNASGKFATGVSATMRSRKCGPWRKPPARSMCQSFPKVRRSADGSRV